MWDKSECNVIILRQITHFQPLDKALAAIGIVFGTFQEQRRREKKKGEKLFAHRNECVMKLKH